MVLDVRELIRRWQAGETDRAIARELQVARKTVAKYRAWAEREGWIEGALPTLEELDVRVRALLPDSNLPRTPFKAEPYRERIEALRRDGVEMRAVFQRLQSEQGCRGSYSALYRYVRHFVGISGPVLHRVDPRIEVPARGIGAMSPPHARSSYGGSQC